mgnify:CR=1 FL=1
MVKRRIVSCSMVTSGRVFLENRPNVLGLLTPMQGKLIPPMTQLMAVLRLRRCLYGKLSVQAMNCRLLPTPVDSPL